MSSLSSSTPSSSVTPPKLELISFKLCPFVQRAIIVLKNKKIDFDITYIDIGNPPEWFKKLSPLGQVPILKVGDEVLFESSVIQEYVDEVTPPSLHPTDPLIKAKNRAWMSFGGDILMLMHGLVAAKDEAGVTEKQDAIKQKLSQLEVVHSGLDFFNGDSFNVIDAAYAPMMMRLDFIKQDTGIDLLQDFPKLAKWSEILLERPCVKSSVVPELPDIYRGMIQHFEGFLSKKLT